MNRPNIPQLRPIEIFWASMKRGVLKRGKIVVDINQFRQIWGVVLRNFTKTVIQKLMRGVHMQIEKLL